MYLLVIPKYFPDPPLSFSRNSFLVATTWMKTTIPFAITIVLKTQPSKAHIVNMPNTYTVAVMLKAACPDVNTKTKTNRNTTNPTNHSVSTYKNHPA